MSSPTHRQGGTKSEKYLQCLIFPMHAVERLNGARPLDACSGSRQDIPQTRHAQVYATVAWEKWTDILARPSPSVVVVTRVARTHTTTAPITSPKSLPSNSVFSLGESHPYQEILGDLQMGDVLLSRPSLHHCFHFGCWWWCDGNQTRFPESSENF